MFPNQDFCPFFQKAIEAFAHLHIPSDYLDPKFNKCYCSNCYKGKEFYFREGEIYEMPLGSCRFALKIRNFSSNSDQEILETWHNSYHSPNENESIASIIEYGYQKPGTILPNGRKIETQNKSHDRNKIYTTPSFRYSLYDGRKKFQGKNMKFILQNRVKPGTYTKEGEILSLTNNAADKFIDPDGIEFGSERTEDVAIIGILVCEANQSQYDKFVLKKGERIASFKAFLILKGEMKYENYNYQYSNLEEIIQKSQTIFDNIFAKISDLKSEIRSQNNGNNIARGILNGSGLIGGVLCFTPLGRVGCGLSICSGFLGIINELSSSKSKKKFEENVKKLISEYNELIKIQEILRIYHHLRSEFIDDVLMNLNRFESSSDRQTFEGMAARVSAAICWIIIGKRSEELQKLSFLLNFLKKAWQFF